MPLLALRKQRYLGLLSSGVFSKFEPAQLDALHKEVGLFLKDESDSLDTTELFDIYELQFYLALLTNHDVEAKSYLDQFNDQFAGKKSQKLMVLRSMYHEATGDLKAAMEALGTDPNELRASRRLATFARTNKDGSYNAPEYIKALRYYLDLQPADELAWAELGDVYSSIGHYEKAVYCFKEVLLLQPDAFNFWYKTGLQLYHQHLYLNGLKGDKKDALLENARVLEHARDCFLKCIEHHEGHVKSWLGVYLSSNSPFLRKLQTNKSVNSTKKVEKLVGEMALLATLSRLQIKKLKGFAEESELDSFLGHLEVAESTGAK